MIVVSDSEIVAAAELAVKNGAKGVAALARAAGCSHYKIRKLRDAGVITVPDPPVGRPPSDQYVRVIDRVLELWDSGMAAVDIAREIGEGSPAHVYDWLKRAGRAPERRARRSGPGDASRFGNINPIPVESQEILGSRSTMASYIQGRSDKSVAGLARDLGCSITTVGSRLYQYDLWSETDRGRSGEENALADMIEGWGVRLERNNRSILKRQEIDMYLPDLRIGIEFNGDYWHGDNRLPANYHLNKTEMAAQEGMFLYHIFEWEWRSRTSQIVAQLRGLCGLDQTVGARQCSVVDVSSSEARAFLETNHRQGATGASVRLGLKHDGDLVALMTFGKPRFDAGSDWELLRFCSADGVRVIGGASRLLKAFRKGREDHSIISYSDRARARGSLYKSIGFLHIRDSKPGYVWVDGNHNVLSRYQTQMKNEDAEMRLRGYWKIHDCGQSVWRLNQSSVS